MCVQHTQTHLVVESGEVCVPSENNPVLIWSLPDQDLEYLQQRKDKPCELKATLTTRELFPFAQHLGKMCIQLMNVCVLSNC